MTRLRHVAEQVVTCDATDPKPFVALEHLESRSGRLVDGVELPVHEPDATSMVSFMYGDVLFGKLRPYLAKSNVLNTPTAWRRPTAPGWDGAEVYWELIDARLRFKVTTPHVDQRRQLRDEWRQALQYGASAQNDTITHPRGASGRSMTAAELGGDVRSALIRDGRVDPDEARRLYERATALFSAAVSRLESHTEL